MAVAAACWLRPEPSPGTFGLAARQCRSPSCKLWLSSSSVALPSLLASRAAPGRPRPTNCKVSAMLEEVVTGRNKGLALALAGCCSGLVAGLLHSCRSPDRLASLAPLAFAQTSRLDAAALGAAWACGHQLGQALFGTAFLLLKNKFRPWLLHPWSEGLIALATLTVGVVATRELLPDRDRDRDKDRVSSRRSWISGRNPRSLALALATGLVYGLQPDALLMTLPVRSVPSRLAGCLFLAMSVLAQVASMSCCSSALTWLAQAAGNRLKWTAVVLRWLSALFALVFGLAMLGLPLVERLASPV